MNMDEIKRQARMEVQDEQIRKAIDAEKAKLRAHRPLLARIFPFKLTITKR